MLHSSRVYIWILRKNRPNFAARNSRPLKRKMFGNRLAFRLLVSQWQTLNHIWILNMTNAHQGSLTRNLVMIVEDQFFIGMNLSMVCKDAGADVLGPFRTEEAALQALSEATEARLPDVALLDVDLGDHTSESIARILQSRGIPFAFHTAQLCENESVYDGVIAPVISKPATDAQIEQTLLSIIERSSG